MGDSGRYRTLPEFLSLFPKVVKTGDGYNCPCPSHPDKNPSLHVSEHEQKILLHCHGGCTTAAVIAALNITESDLFLNRNGHTPAPATDKPKLVKTYDYTDATGVLLFQVCRFEPKDFRQRRPDGQGGWIYDLKTVVPVLYRLPAIMAAVARQETVYIVEGEKDADNLSGTGVCATSSPMGAGKWKQSYTETLTGATVVIIPDSDPPGIAHGESIRASLAGVAASVRLLRIPTGRGKDISDWLESGGTLAGLVEIIPPIPTDRPTGILAVLATPDSIPASNPAVSTEIDGISLTWGPEHIRCDIARLYQHTNGEVACELYFTYCLSGEEPHYVLRHHINDLANSSTRDRLAILLGKHYKGLPWPAMVHQICEYTLLGLRAPPTGVSSFDFSETHRPQFLLHPFLIRHENNLLFAPGGGGKSYLAEFWMALLELQSHEFPGWIVRQENITGLFLDWERSYNTNAYRFGQILQGLAEPLACPDAPFNYCKFSRPLIQEVRNIQILINKFHANFIICDSAGMAAGGDINKPEPAMDYFRGLGSLHAHDGGPLTTLTLAHTAKNAEGKRSAYGNAYWTNEPSSVWELIPSEDSEHNISRLTLRDNKHNYGWSPDVGLSIEFHGDERGTVYSPCDAVAKLAPGEGHEYRILDVLDSPRGPAEIAKLTGLSENIVSVILQRMLKTGSVSHVSRGLWEVVS